MDLQVETNGTFDAIIVGAGMSGLIAARDLQRSGLKVLVLEARDRVGGRIYTIKSAKAPYVDMGAAYIAPTQRRVLKLAKEFGLKTYPTNEKEDLLYYEKGKTYRFRTVFPPIGGLLSWLDMNNILRLIDKMGEEVPVDAPWTAPHAKEWDAITVQQFIDKVAWTKAGKYVMTDSIRLNNAVAPQEVSLLYIIWHYKTVGGINMINATEDGAQEMKMVGGNMQLCTRLAEQIGTENILLGHPVSEIDQTVDNFVKVKVNNGTEFQCKRVILATPLSIQAQTVIKPALPPERNQLIQRVPMGCATKVFVYYDTPFWKEKGCCGSANINDPNSLICFTMDNSQPDGSLPALVCFIVADKARQFAKLSPEQRQEHVKTVLSGVFGAEEALRPSHYEEMDWSRETYSGGCYFLALPPGILTTFGNVLRQPVDRVYFAGTETAAQWVGYMEGAIQAGNRAAREVQHSLGLLSEAALKFDEDDKLPEISSERLKRTFVQKHAPSVPGFLGFTCMAGLGLAALSKL